MCEQRLWASVAPPLLYQRGNHFQGLVSLLLKFRETLVEFGEAFVGLGETFVEFGKALVSLGKAFLVLYLCRNQDRNLLIKFSGAVLAPDL